MILDGGIHIDALRPLVLATRTFRSQGAATSFFQEMLGRYRLGDRVLDADAADLRSLIDQSPLKRGIYRHQQMVDHFEVQHSGFGKTCFRAVFNNGSWTRFSYIKCIVPIRIERRQWI